MATAPVERRALTTRRRSSTPSTRSRTRRARRGRRRSTVAFQLHPPALRALGRDKKISFGPRSHGSLRTLARMKRLRGTATDPFGRAHLRKVERELHDHYRALVLDLAADPTALASNYDRAVRIAELPDLVRGYEHVKLRNVERCATALGELGV